MDKNDQVQRKGLWVNGRDNGLVSALGHQLLKRVAIHGSFLPTGLSLWPMINTLILEKQVIDFKRQPPQSSPLIDSIDISHLVNQLRCSTRSWHPLGPFAPNHVSSTSSSITFWDSPNEKHLSTASSAHQRGVEASYFRPPLRHPTGSVWYVTHTFSCV